MDVSTKELWDDFSCHLRKFILKRVQNSYDAEDILQEVFYKVHKNLDGVKDSNRIPAWIYQTTRHAIVDYYRNRKAFLEIWNASLGDSENYDELDSTRLEAMPCLKLMIEKLPSKYREAVQLVYIEEMTQKELAQKLGLSVSGAKSRVQRAREKLKEMLLECCNFEWDSVGNIIEYRRK